MIGAERDRRIAVFNPDKQKTNSFFHSLRHAPAEYQFVLHAALLKDCKAYGWSYRTMDVHPIPNNAAVNVLPHKWVKEWALRNIYRNIL